MKNFFYNLQQKLRIFMVGRYGNDRLNNFLMILSMLLLLLSIFIRHPVAKTIIWCMALALIILTYFRMFSKNTAKRFQENRVFERVYYSVKGKIQGWTQRLKESKTHRFFTCPNCRQTVRVPKGKGKIRITCPKCKTAFIKKT